MMPFFRPRAVVVASILATVAALFYYSSIPPARDLFFFEVTLASPAEGIAQLYYDTGHGFRENDSTRQPVPAGPAPAVYRFPLPTGTFRALRFDPLNQAATVEFSGARIVDRQGGLVREFGPAVFSPLHQVASLTPHAGGLRLVATGDDPYLAMAIGDPFTLREGSAVIRGLLQAALLFPFVFLPCSRPGCFRGGQAGRSPGCSPSRSIRGWPAPFSCWWPSSSGSPPPRHSMAWGEPVTTISSS